MFKQAKMFTPYRTWRLCLWSIWINPITYPLRLAMVALSLKLMGTPPIEVLEQSSTNQPEGEQSNG